MQIVDPPQAPHPALPAPRRWPCLASAWVAGLLEWAALCRSRGLDAWQVSRHRVKRG